MAENINSRITQAVSRMEYGAVFSVYDFLSYGNYDTVKRTIHRIERKHLVSRVMNGLYYRSFPSGKPPEMKNIAVALARKFCWTITPSREHCLFLLGLSEEDDDGTVFMSTGPARRYRINGRTLTFRHTMEKDIAGIGEKSAIVVEALRAVGKTNITVRTLSVMRSHLTIKEMETMRCECARVTGWIYEAIKALTYLE